VITAARVTKAYQLLIGLAAAAWGSLVVDSVHDRLEVTGIESDDKDVDDVLWGVWQDEKMDAESKLAHKTSLIAGRSFALVWPDDDGDVSITLDGPGQMLVRYAEGSRRKRVSAFRYWADDSDSCPYCNLYTPLAIYKFVGPKDAVGPSGIQWKPRDTPGEPWPVPNPFGVVPVVELPVNRRLKPGSWGYARGEFEHVTSVIDRINLLTFIGLIVAFWQGFPIRAVLGDRVLRDDDGNALPPFELAADQVVQFENPDVKLASFPAADRGNLSVYAELGHLAALTKTPITAFPHEGSIANISSDAILSLERPLVGKIPAHKSAIGEGWEEVLRLAGVMLDDPVVLSQRAELTWTDHSTRSLAERADAAVKLSSLGLPLSAVAELALNTTQEQLARWKAESAGDVMGQLLQAAATPAPMSMPVNANALPLTPPQAPNGNQMP
jgi:hypothetical protein